MTIDRTEARQRLDIAASRADRNRFQRLSASPWKTIYPCLLRGLRISHQTSAATFWGGRLNVVLPEAVSTHIWRHGFFEQDVCFFLLESLSSGMVFLDIGAHFGFFSLFAGELVGAGGRVVALEPMPTTFAHLSMNVARHGHLRNIAALNYAAYSAQTSLPFHDYGLVDAGFNSAFAMRREQDPAEPVRTVTVDARTCDELVTAMSLPPVDVVKIDAESSELHVLRGMEQVIARSQPRIIMEVGDFDLPGVASSAELVDWLLCHGYIAYEHSAGRLMAHKVRARYGYANLLFVHGGIAEKGVTSSPTEMSQTRAAR
jgi:FkbM family methyltransferase